MTVINIDQFSFTSVPLQMYFDDQYLSHGTAFFYKHCEDIYLITNWHNLAGRNPYTKKTLNSNGGVPNRVWYCTYSQTSDSMLVPKRQEAYLNNSEDKPVWLEHSTFKSDVDIAALKITLPSNCIVYPINTLLSHPISVGIGMEVFVLGFPAQLFTGHLPIWKRATIASEYNFNINNIPSFLIDTATYNGMSGSPVILRTRETYKNTEGRTAIISGGAAPTLFLGIYSGRYTLEHNLIKEKVDEEFLYKAQLGIVWKKELIDKVISNGIIPEL
jgi:hypothetical protein